MQFGSNQLLVHQQVGSGSEKQCDMLEMFPESILQILMPSESEPEVSEAPAI